MVCVNFVKKNREMDFFNKWKLRRAMEKPHIFGNSVRHDFVKFNDVLIVCVYTSNAKKKGITLDESWFIVARSVQIHSLDVPDFLSILYDPPAPPWPPSSSVALIHTACWGSCALCLSRLVRRWLKLQWPLPTLITALYGFRIEQTTRDSETVLNSLQSECNRDSVALFV